ncbi:hypothetical protein HanRHA438_Chr10g0459021 [Helianthus annuus]|nr:hypothetical protein HanRHA438_Chr10g0459021 [Helianthus annuus]
MWSVFSQIVGLKSQAFIEQVILFVKPYLFTNYSQLLDLLILCVLVILCLSI